MIFSLNVFFSYCILSLVENNVSFVFFRTDSEIESIKSTVGAKYAILCTF